MAVKGREDFLRIPPFPGSRPASLTSPGVAKVDLSAADVDFLIDRVAELRVGGDYWGSQPQLPDGPYTLIRIRDQQSRAERVANLGSNRPVLVADEAEADPWHLVGGAAEAIVDADDELALIAALAGIPVRPVGKGPFAMVPGGGRAALREAFRRHVVKSYACPFTSATMSCAEAVELSGFWRSLIDSNRPLTGRVGFASWKRQTVAPLLWGGSASAAPLTGKARRPNPSDRIAVWKSRTSSARLAELQSSSARLVEVEDGFIRSIGLGADCVPPLSIVVDHLGIYFDPSRPSALERLLNEGDFSAELLARAAQLRELIVTLGVTKYGVGHTPIDPRHNGKCMLLVVGQVEDDRAVLGGLGPSSNLELLERVRASNPQSHLIYKPHPDVEAGHRKGVVADAVCLTLADEIVRDASMPSLIGLVDEVHVNTSLAGFEALLRGKQVTTYGVPFYAGWGLTRDLGPVPSRRNSRRTLDELVAAALLLYPRYLDPVSGLPCPPEVLVNRLADGRPGVNAPPLVRLRRLQGRLNRKLSSFRRTS